MQRYKVEPYVVCADVYSEPPHVGRGGWTWYTGSAGWMYRAGLESILGVRLRGAELILDPCVPRSWRGFEIAFRYGSARYQISVENPRGSLPGRHARRARRARRSRESGRGFRWPTTGRRTGCGSSSAERALRTR